MRSLLQGFPNVINRLQEIAEAVGYKTHGAVLKRIRHIADCYEDFISEEYQKYLETF